MNKLNLFLLLIIIAFVGCKKSTNIYAKNASNKELSDENISIESENDKALANAEGIWHFEKAAQYGGFISGKDYYYTKEALDTIYKNITFKISDYNIAFSNGCIAGFSIKKVDISTFFAGKLVNNSEDTYPSNEEIKDFYKKEFNIIMKDTITMFSISSCKYPFNRLLIFPDKIIIIESGVCNFSFVKEANNKDKEYVNEKVRENDVLCNKIEGTMNSGESCTYYGKTIKQVYPIILNKYKDESKHLKRVLPANNIEYKSNVDEENVQIAYNFKSQNKLLIELSYEGGVTEIELYEEKGNTMSKIIYNAD